MRSLNVTGAPKADRYRALAGERRQGNHKNNHQQQKQNDTSCVLFRGKIRGKNKQAKVRRTLITERCLNVDTFDFGNGTEKDF